MGACIKRYIESTSVTESFGEKSSFSAADIWINLGYVGNEGEEPHTYAWDIPISENHYLPDAFFRSVLFGKLLFCGTLTMSNCRFKSNGIIRKKSARKRQICMYKNFRCFSRKKHISWINTAKNLLNYNSIHIFQIRNCYQKFKRWRSEELHELEFLGPINEWILWKRGAVV